jgi:hypothetical protein
MDRKTKRASERESRTERHLDGRDEEMGLFLSLHWKKDVIKGKTPTNT